jgi:hypothetical protein
MRAREKDRRRFTAEDAEGAERKLRGPDTTAVSADFSRISEVLAGPLREMWDRRELLSSLPFSQRPLR